MQKDGTTTPELHWLGSLEPQKGGLPSPFPIWWAQMPKDNLSIQPGGASGFFLYWRGQSPAL